MGLKLMFNSRTESAPGVRNQIDRSELVRRVTSAVDRSGLREIKPVLAERLVMVARNADYVDALAWRCTGSCGCPLTQAGVVNFGSEFDGEKETNHAAKDAAERFYHNYDNSIKTYLRERGINTSGASGVTLTVVG